jgi:hypothetical protein
MEKTMDKHDGNFGKTMANFVGLLTKKDCEVERLLILKVDAQKPTNTAGVSTQLLVDCGDSGFWPRQNET